MHEGKEQQCLARLKSIKGLQPFERTDEQKTETMPLSSKRVTLQVFMSLNWLSYLCNGKSLLSGTKSFPDDVITYTSTPASGFHSTWERICKKSKRETILIVVNA